MRFTFLIIVLPLLLSSCALPTNSPDDVLLQSPQESKPSAPIDTQPSQPEIALPTVSEPPDDVATPSEHPDRGFAFANMDGSKLLLLFNWRVDNRELSGFKYAVSREGDLLTLESVGYQEWSPESNGRETMFNFDNCEGVVYEVTSGTAHPNLTYLVMTEEAYKDIELISTASTDFVTIQQDVLQVYAEMQDRKVKNGWIIAELCNGAKISAIEFESKDRDLLAWIVYEHNDEFLYCPFPAELMEDGFSGWSYGDCGELSPFALYVLTVAKNNEQTEVFLGWCDEEGEIVKQIVLKEDGESTEESVAGRYMLGV